MDQSADHPDAHSLAGGVNWHHAIKMNTLAILFGHDLELGMLHDEPLSAQFGTTIGDHAGACEDRFLHMEEIEPTQDQASAKGCSGQFLQFRFKATHASETPEDRFADRAAETECAFTFRIRKMVKETPVLVPPGIMLQQVSQCEDAQLAKGGNLRTGDPSKLCKGNCRIVGRY